ncbi:hypothetical protein [Streptomyces sp. WMMC940]|uniref:hypothetical protein n=1 Tax=Streptomyces sp. WMMC940 TaxID=3015153 RepID=UPI0022B6F992|nr:hypothetical protein [Streptomyces sp. WMMC940]MCZ7461919.1 hypothetical protein [Streptomyces sp. WMMC940]
MLCSPGHRAHETRAATAASDVRLRLNRGGSAHGGESFPGRWSNPARSWAPPRPRDRSMRPLGNARGAHDRGDVPAAPGPGAATPAPAGGRRPTRNTPYATATMLANTTTLLG